MCRSDFAPCSFIIRSTFAHPSLCLRSSSIMNSICLRSFFVRSSFGNRRMNEGRTKDERRPKEKRSRSYRETIGKRTENYRRQSYSLSFINAISPTYSACRQLSINIFCNILMQSIIFAYLCERNKTRRLWHTTTLVVLADSANRFL